MITKTRVLPAVLWLGFFLVAAFPVAEVLAQSKDDIIAVFDIENRAPSFNEAALERLNDYLFFSLASAGFKLTPRTKFVNAWLSLRQSRTGTAMMKPVRLSSVKRLPPKNRWPLD